MFFRIIGLAQITPHLTSLTMIYERERTSIQRTYRNVLMRSHAEARMASFLDFQNLNWLYEPEKIGPLHYLPDFYLPDLETYIEVKPRDVSIAELAKFYLTAESILPHKTFILMYIFDSWSPLVWDIFFQIKDSSEWIWASSLDSNQSSFCRIDDFTPLNSLIPERTPNFSTPGRYAILTWDHPHPEWNKK
jgi:hypothetical protein